LNKFFVAKSSVTSRGGKTYEIRVNIGYNVNGAHNGVWLPGNYAIRAANPVNPLKKNWGDVSDADFKTKYMVAAMRKVGGKQFHDAHPDYNAAVRDTLDKISVALFSHLDTCEECKGNSDGKINPPYRMKKLLYARSAYLKTLCVGGPSSWKGSYFTSSPLKTEMAADRQGLLNLYNAAQP
jgi:hypothetical protein